MANHKIEIKAFPPVAVVAPGVRKVCRGDTITFDNQTGGPVRIFTADDHVLEGVDGLSPKLIRTYKKRKFTVEASKGTHEISAHYKYKDKTKNNRLRTGFAIGASSPKIIVVPPKK